MDIQRFKPHYTRSIAHLCGPNAALIGQYFQATGTRTGKRLKMLYRFVTDLPSILKTCGTESRQALFLCLLLMLLVNLHRDLPDTSIIPLLQVPTATLRGSVDKPVTPEASARQIADAQQRDETFTGIKSTQSSLGTRTTPTQKSSSLAKKSVEINPRAPEKKLRLPGPTIEKSLQRNPTRHSRLDTWLNTHPVLRKSREFGFSRPQWRSYEHVSLLKRFGEQSATDIYTVMLDPGHGGSDPGAVGHNGLLEKEITLDVARRTALFLSEAPNIRVQMTRQSDRGMSRFQRVTEIKNSQADVVVSLHLNHLPQTELTLVETFYAGPANIRESQLKQAEESAAEGIVRTSKPAIQNLTFTTHSAQLAHIMQNHIFDEVKHSNAAAISAGVKQDTLFVLTRSFTPGALIEMTCLSNEEEANLLATENYRNRLAAALADGIQEYVTEQKAAEDSRQLASGELTGKSI